MPKRATWPLPAVCVHAALAAGAESVAQLSALAAVLFRCEDLRGALALYQRAAAHGVHDPEVQRGLAFTYRALGQITQAEQAADRALEGAPDRLRAHPSEVIAASTDGGFQPRPPARAVAGLRSR